MKRLLATALLLVLPVSAAADDAKIALRQHALQLINRDRVAHNLRPVALDLALSRSADRRAVEVLHDQPLDVPIYLYYSHLGFDDSVTENIHAWSVTYPLTEHALRELTRRTQKTMIDEKAPYDGRRAAILDPFATHAGIGFASHDGELRIVQIFARRYVHWATPLPRCATTTDVATVAGWPLGDTAFDAITVHFEPARPREKPRLRRRKKPETTIVNNHALPARRREYLPKLGSSMRRHQDGEVTFLRFQYGPRRYGEVEVGPHGDFTFDVPFTEGPGIYTVVVWVRFVQMADPFPATMTSVVVEEPAPSAGAARP